MNVCTLDELIGRLNAMPLPETAEPPLVTPKPIAQSGKLSSDSLIRMVINGQDWHTNMLQLVAHWVGRKLSDEEILLTARSLTLTGYTVDQTIAEMSGMIASARKKWQVSNPGQELKESVSLIAITLGEFLGMDIPPRGMIIAPIIPTQGLGMMYAARGIGKTYVALTIALAVATGASMFGDRWSAAKPWPVLFIDGEMPAIVLQERLKSLAANFAPVEDGYLRIITPDHQEHGIPDLATEEGQIAIEKHLDGVKLVILDNLSSLLRNGRENEADSWLPLQSWLLSLRRRGISVLIIHHAGKSGNQRGTSKREDLLDTVIHLKRPANYDPTHGAQFEVHYEKARGFFGDEAKPFDARLGGDREGLCWEVMDIQDALAEQVKELRAEGLSQRDIATQLGTSAATVNRIVKKLDPLPVLKQDEIEF